MTERVCPECGDVELLPDEDICSLCQMMLDGEFDYDE